MITEKQKKITKMRGQKKYSLAQAISEQLYANPNGLTDSDKLNLYKSYVELLKKAAYVGHLDALYEFGQQFENTNYLHLQNPNYNPKKAIYWYSKACEKEYGEACNNLGSMYDAAEGCTRDVNLALKFYKKAHDLGSPSGKKNYKSLLSEMKML